MTAPNTQATEKRVQYQINLTTESAKELARIMFEEREGLSQCLATHMDVQFITSNSNYILVLGAPETENKVTAALLKLTGALEGGSHISKNLIKKIGRELNPRPDQDVAQQFDIAAAANQNDKPSSHKREATPAQKDLERQIGENDLTFAIGPAGTGKTYVAMKMGVEALKARKVKKLLLARPATEAGEKIGFLPGTQEDKLAPYMRPLYDELDKAFGRGTWKKMMDNGQIEVVPVGYMRGRTFEDAFIILDESQNCTKEQFKMAITRIGYGSKMVVTGDQSQIDLPRKEDSGLFYYFNILKGKAGIGAVAFEGADVVRSKIVQTVVDSIEAYEKSDTPENAAAPAVVQAFQDSSTTAKTKPSPRKPAAMRAKNPKDPGIKRK